LLSVTKLSVIDSLRIAAVLPTGRNFGRKTQMWPHKNLSGRKIFWQIYQKMTEKWPNFFEGHLSHKNLDFIAEIYSSMHL
jgi:hypothetical protein